MYRQIDDLKVIDYCDSDYVGYIDTRKSTSGYVFMLAGGVGSQRSAKQSLTITSTMEAEFVFLLRQPHMAYGLRVLYLGLELQTLFLGR